MKKSIILLLLFSSLSVSIQAQQTMTLEACRQMAVENNQDLKKAQFQKQEALTYTEVAKTAYLPSFSANVSSILRPSSLDANVPGGFLPTAESAEAAQNGEFNGVSDVWSPGLSLDLDNLFLFMADVSIAQPIYTGGKIKYSEKQAEAGVEMASNAYALTYSDIIEQIDQAYWNMVKITSNVDLANQYILMLTELEDQLTEMQNLGLIAASEVLKVSVQKNEAELNLLRAENGLKLSKMYLNRLIGQDLDIDIQAVDSLETSVQVRDFSNGVQAALSQRKELQLLETRLKISEYEKMIEQADYLPQAGISLGYSATHIRNLTDTPNFSPMVSAQVSVPIFQWGQAKYKAQAADLRTKQLAIELDNTQELINLEVQNVRIQMEEAYEAIVLARKNILQAEENLEETQASFEVGLNTTSELLQAKADWQSANTRLINALAQYKILDTSWERVTGKLSNSL